MSLPDTVKKLWPLIVFTAAVAVRFAFLGQFQNSPFFYPDAVGLDQSLYHKWAKALAAGYWPGNNLLYSHPVYPYLVSFYYRFFTPDSYSIVVIQHVLGALSCVLLYYIGKKVFSAKAGMISSFLAAVYGPFLFYEGFLVPSASSIFLTLAAVILLLSLLGAISLGRVVLAGLLLGMSVATNSAIALFLIAATAWTVYVLRLKKVRPWFLYISFFALSAMLPTMLLSYKHFFTEGRFDSFAAHGGINFYIGNNPDANGLFDRAPLGFNPTAEGLSEDSTRYAEKLCQRRLSAAQVSGFWYKKAFSYIKQNPIAWFRLLLTKFILFSNRTEVGDIADYYLCKEDSLLLKFNPFVFWLVAPLGVLGMVLAGRHKGPALLLYSGAFSVMFSCMLFFINSRYRLTAVPFLMLFAGFAVLEILEKIKSKDKKGLKANAILLTGFFIFSGLPAVPVNTVTPRYNLSVILAEHGDYDTAIKICEKLLKENPGIAAIHFNLAVCYYKKGRLDDALCQFKEALRLSPNDCQSRFNLGFIYYQKKEYKKAEAEFIKLIILNKKDPEAHYGLGKVLEAQGRYKEALFEYKLVLKVIPGLLECSQAVDRVQRALNAT